MAAIGFIQQTTVRLSPEKQKDAGRQKHREDYSSVQSFRSFFDQG